MNGELKFWLIFWLLALIAFNTLILGSVYMNKAENIKMAELGYQQTAVLGTSTPLWQKYK